MFDNLPRHTVQRVTLEQLNHAYCGIYDLFMQQNEKPKKPITIKQLSEKGVKLIGQSGNSITNCLRSLKLIEMNRQGIYLSTPYPVKPSNYSSASC